MSVKNKIGTWLFSVFLFPVFLLFSCKEYQEIKVSEVKNFRLTKISKEAIEGEVILGISNPNTAGFSIYPSEFDVTYSGINLGKARLYKRVHIGPHTEKDYVFKLRSDLKGVNIMDLTGLFGGKLGSIEVKGDLKAGKFFLKKRFPVNIKQKIDLRG
jgi:LEA14-like dessication related protein